MQIENKVEQCDEVTYLIKNLVTECTKMKAINIYQINDLVTKVKSQNDMDKRNNKYFSIDLKAKIKDIKNFMRRQKNARERIQEELKQNVSEDKKNRMTSDGHSNKSVSPQRIATPEPQNYYSNKHISMNP